MAFQRIYEELQLVELSQKVYRKAVRAVIEEKGKLLLLKTNQGDYKFPGGGVKLREKEEEALKREVQEETGYEVSSVKEFLGSAVERKKDDFREDTLFEMESLYFRCQVTGEPGPQALEGYELDLGFTPEWLTVDEAIRCNEQVLAKGRNIHFRWVQRETEVLKLLKKELSEAHGVTTLYFVRHAEPVHSHREDATRPLSLEGTTDALMVTEYFRQLQVDAFYSSPYKRSVDTIAGCAEEKKKEIAMIWNLRERESGPGGNGKDLIRKRWSDFEFHEDQGESLSQVQERNMVEVHRILEKEQGKTVVIGTHGTALSTILHYFDSSFDADAFFRIIDFMPYIVKFQFQGQRLLTIQEEFYRQKLYTGK